MTEEEQEQEQPIEELDNELERLRQDAEEFRDKYMRSLADHDNAQKRLVRERQEIAKHAVRDVLCEFLHPLDHFESALKHAEASSPDVKNWAIGFEMILTQFKDVLAAHNITAMETVGKHFDPHIHEAVETVETEETPEGIIVEEILRGYKIGDRTLRAAKVKVAKAPQKLQEETNQEQEKTDD